MGRTPTARRMASSTASTDLRRVPPASAGVLFSFVVAHGGVGRYQPRGLGQTLEEIPQGRYTGLHDPRNVGVDPGLRLGLRGRPALHCADVDAEVVS